MTEVVNETEEPTKHTLVLYTDGGSRGGNPGFSGWGIHGYLCVPKVLKKGSGHPTHVPTNYGYIRKSELSKVEGGYEVDVVKYFDEVGSFDHMASNNLAELTAALRAFEIANHLVSSGVPVGDVFLQSDSMYVIDGLNKWVHGWLRSNWMRPDGERVKNADLWIKLLNASKELKAQGAHWTLQWVRAHNGEPGNERSDMFATIGVFIAYGSEAGKVTLKETDPNGYWKTETERHPMLSFPVMFYNTDGVETSKGTYLLTNTRMTDDQHGVRDGAVGYSIVVLEEPDSTIETVRARSAYVSSQYGRPGLMQLSVADLFNGKHNTVIDEYGSWVIKPLNTQKMDLVTPAADKVPLIREMKPVFACNRVLEAIEALNNIHEMGKQGAANIVMTDVTNIFYEKVKVKKGKSEVVQMQLLPEYIVGYQSKIMDVMYNTGTGIQIKEIKVILGTDILDRNALKRLEALEPEISILTWAESETCFRYATVIKAKGCIGIWSGYFSNYIFLSPEKK